MKTLTVERDQIVKAIVQLTHADIDRAQWPWMVAFDPSQEQPLAEVVLPDEISGQGGFHTLHREAAYEKPETAHALPEPATATPLDFSSLHEDFRWQGEVPDPAHPLSWTQGETRRAVEEITRTLRREVVIDGEHYRVEYR